MTSECRECQEIKPQFVQSQGNCLIKSTQPFEKLYLDFKGPLPSTTKNRYFVTTVLLMNTHVFCSHSHVVT